MDNMIHHHLDNNLVSDVDCNIDVVAVVDDDFVVLVGEVVDEYVDVVEDWMDDDDVVVDVVVVALDVDIVVDVVPDWDVRMMKNALFVH